MMTRHREPDAARRYPWANISAAQRQRPVRKKAILELLREYASLDDEKTRRGGSLSPEGEKRWVELKSFYDLLMEQRGFPRRVSGRFSIVDIRQTIVPRARLRVRTEMEVAVLYKRQYHITGVLNLSCGGVLLAADEPFVPGSRLMLFLAAISGRDATEGEIVWCTELSSRDGTCVYKAGIRFINLSESVCQKLDSFVVETLEKQLLALDVSALDREFVHREGLAL
jgi:hypothetical protein